MPTLLEVQTALRKSLVDRDDEAAAKMLAAHVPADRLDATIQEFCEAILSSSPDVLALGKAAFYDQLSCDEASAYQRAVEIITDNATRADAQEGIRAFLEKRQPVWGTSDTTSHG